MLLYVKLAIILKITAAQHFEIEDIPIEQFEHDDALNDAIDVELMARPSRSLVLGPNLQEKTHNRKDIEHYRTDASFRRKRDVNQPKFLTNLSKEKKDLVEGLGRPLELSEIDAENVSEKPKTLAEGEAPSSKDELNFLINDFIRFKRSTEQENLNGEESGEQKANSNTKDPPQSQKLVMNPTQKDQQDNARETRGATKEQWVKQVYPIRRSDDVSYDENIQSADSMHAPRVHFVTQGMAEAASERKYNREGRNDDFRKPVSRNLDRDMYSDMGYYQSRYTRNYDPVSYRQPRYFDPYYNYDPRDPRERNQYRPNDYPERTRNNYSADTRRQRRIIYYATLPEVSRPPNADLRERYDYRDGRDRERDRYYDDRYYSPDPYRYRKGYVKPRYEEREMEKNPYPVKVSTDVNVRDVKKSPETRIYSDVDRNRYAQTTRT